MNAIPKLVHLLRSCYDLAVAILTIVWAAFLLRVYARRVLLGRFGSDDWAMVLAVLFFTLSISIVLVVVTIVHDYTLGHVPATLDKIHLYIEFAIGFYTLSMLALKISSAIFFCNIFVERWQRIVVQVTVALYVAFGLAMFVMDFLPCGLSLSFYSFSTILGSCQGFDIFINVNRAWSTFNAATDCMFAILSIIALYPSKLPTATKITAVALLLLGTGGCIASIVRVVFLFNVDTAGNYLNIIVAADATIIENAAGLIAASAACLRPVLHCLHERRKSTCEATRRHGLFRDSMREGLIGSDYGYNRMSMDDVEKAHSPSKTSVSTWTF